MVDARLEVYLNGIAIGYSRLQSNTNFQLLGEGSWHKAYLVKLKGIIGL